MIYEIRTYDLKQGTVAEFERRTAERLPSRLTFSKLGGFWHTEIGPLNQVIHIWPYKDLNERSEIRQQALASGTWPPDNAEFVLNARSEIYFPAPFMTDLGERNIGPFYDMRIYTYAVGVMPKVLDDWSRLIIEREKLSPLAGCWYSEFGALNRFIHLWAYKSLDERQRIREEANAKGIWRLDTVPTLRQEVKVLLPASFSPMQ